MWILSSGSLYELGEFNRELFLADQGTSNIRAIKDKIRAARDNLLNLMRDLEIARARPAIQPVSLEALESFCATHPAMTIRADNGVISLLSKNQSVAFHTARGRNSHGQNNDVIYVTLPLYGFRLDFHPDGKVSGCAMKSEDLQRIAGEQIHSFGHPHATNSGSGLSFQSICNGNNRFIQDWHRITKANSLSGPVLMRIMSQAAVWMETANLSDMYGTLLAGGVPGPSFSMSANEALRLYQTYSVESAPAFMENIHRFGGEDLYRRCLYSIWLFGKFRALAARMSLKEALYEAIVTDLLVMKHDSFLGCTLGKFAKELERTNEIALRCFYELKGFCPGLNGKTMSDLCPELFHTEEQHAYNLNA